MTTQSRPVQYGDYLYALAVRVLREDLLLQARRASLFEDEPAVSGDLQPLDLLAPAPAHSGPAPAITTRMEQRELPARSASLQPPAHPGHGQDGLLVPPPSRSEPALAIAPRAEYPAPPALPERPATLRAALLEPTVPAMPETRIIASRAPIEIPAAPAPRIAAPTLPMEIPAAPTSRIAASKRPIEIPATPPAAPAAPAQRIVAAGRGLQPGACISPAVPEIRNLVPLFPRPQQTVPEPPPVEIIIGRLEIRAAAAKAPAETVRATPARHALKEYLARKTGDRP